MKTAIIHSDSYEKHITGDGHPEPQKRVIAIKEHLKKMPWLVLVALIRSPPEPATHHYMYKKLGTPEEKSTKIKNTGQQNIDRAQVQRLN